MTSEAGEYFIGTAIVTSDQKGTGEVLSFSYDEEKKDQRKVRWVNRFLGWYRARLISDIDSRVKNTLQTLNKTAFKQRVEKMKLGICMEAHKFFNDEERRKWQNPEAILADIGLKTGFTFIDIGCGQGFFTVPAAKIVGERGKVYGLDVDEEAIAFLRKKALTEGLTNLMLQVGEAEKTIFCKSCADVVFFGIVFHDFDDRAKVLMNAKRMLRTTGRLVDLDWKKEAMELGPPLRIRFSDEEEANLIKKAGFHIQTIKEAGPYHYVVIARSLSNR